MSMDLGPYTNFHELNQDWFLSEFNRVLKEWAEMKKSFKSLNDAFNDLRNYVHDYFKNLDVQKEIDNKLNAMAKDGSLSDLIKPFIVTNLPPVVVDDTSKMTDRYKMYILKTSGHLYQWDSELNGFSDTGLTYGTIGNIITTDIAISEGNLDDVAVNTLIALSFPTTGNGYINIPVNRPAYLLTYRYGASNEIKMQIIYSQDDKYIWWRKSNISGKWSEWVNITTGLANGGTVGIDNIKYPYTSLRDMNDAPLNTIISLNSPLPNGESYLNTPENIQGAGYVLTFQWGDNSKARLQFYYKYTNGLGYYRVRLITGTWTDWKVNNNSITYNSTKTVNENSYSNTYNITSSPTIKSDSNGWLASSNDTANRLGDIMNMLNSTGYCHLGEGIFYIKGQIEMPPNSIITGCGNKTIIKSSSDYEGPMIIPGEYCTISNFKIQANGKPGKNVGDETGILIYDTKTSFSGSGSESTHMYKCNRIEGIFFSNFNGSGIQMRGTGGSTPDGSIISNCRFENCSIGINFSFFTEYNKVDSCIIGNTNYIGVINNGGNNSFVNCTISGSNSAFVIDNNDGTLINEAHGLCSGCLFNHTGGNVGDAIRILGTNNGFLFNGCEYWYGVIRINNSKGITFNGIHGGGDTNKIIVSNSSGILFSSMQLNSTPEITNNNNKNLRFINCYNYITGNPITGDPITE